MPAGEARLLLPRLAQFVPPNEANHCHFAGGGAYCLRIPHTRQRLAHAASGQPSRRAEALTKLGVQFVRPITNFDTVWSA
jgi:hypothetical protein